MEVGMPPKKITERMYGDNGPRNRVLFRNGFLEEFLQGLPGATTEFREQVSVIEEIPAEDFGYAENEMTVGNGSQDVFAKPLAEFNDTLLVTGWTEVPSFT
jgi:hypothetical protein